MRTYEGVPYGTGDGWMLEAAAVFKKGLTIGTIAGAVVTGQTVQVHPENYLPFFEQSA